MWLLLMAAGMILGEEWEWLAVIPAALLHEGGHYVTARLCGIGVTGMRLGFFGARMRLEGMISYGKEFCIALGGPLVNLVSAWAVWLSQGKQLSESPLELFFYASLGLGLLNLLPVGTMDGGRMLSALLSRWLSPDVAMRTLKVTTTLCLFVLWLLACYALLRGAPVLSSFIFILALMLQYARADGARRGVNE